MTMILAMDTSTPTAALVVCGAHGALVGAGSATVAAPHGRGLIPAVRDLLAAAGVELAALDGLAVGLGPGSFTGLRIGVTAVKTLAYATGKPVVGLDSLEVLAANAPASEIRIAVAVDSQRGDLSTAEFARERAGGPLVRVGPMRLEPGAAWLERLEPGTLVLGPGLERLAGPIPERLRRGDPAWDVVQPLALAAVAGAAWTSGRRDDLWALAPVYARRSAAEEKRQASSSS